MDSRPDGYSESDQEEKRDPVRTETIANSSLSPIPLNTNTCLTRHFETDLSTAGRESVVPTSPAHIRTMVVSLATVCVAPYGVDCNLERRWCFPSLARRCSGAANRISQLALTLTNINDQAL